MNKRLQTRYDNKITTFIGFIYMVDHAWTLGPLEVTNQRKGINDVSVGGVTPRVDINLNFLLGYFLMYLEKRSV